MLFNFPKEEISKFYEKIFGKMNSSEKFHPKEQFRSELYESIANFNIHPVKIEEELKVEDESFGSSMEELNGDNEISGNDSKLNNLKPLSLNAQLRKPSFEDDEKVRRRKNSVYLQVKKRKVIPTNVGNQIAIWSDSIYDNYGHDNKLYFNEFIEWAVIHKNVIFTFARYFRYSMWQSFQNKLTNKEYLGFHKLTPVLQEDFLIKFSSEKQFRSAHGCLNIEFLFIWYERSRTIPNIIKILKDVNIIFTDSDNQIDIQHYSLEYHNFTIKINRKPVFLYWKEILTNFSRLNKK